jgi:OTU domain-containing protein 6
VSDRQVESTLIEAKLAQLKLTIKDIPSDGHCMYHAVADQMISHGISLPSSLPPDFQKLRQLTSEYMLNHPDDFMPFLALDLNSGKDMTGTYYLYCYDQSVFLIMVLVIVEICRIVCCLL